jgi:Gpi18-like mannosyltransferase
MTFRLFKFRTELIDLGLIACSTWGFISFLSILWNGTDFAGPYVSWMASFLNYGFVSGYKHINDVYPPGTYCVLVFAAKLGSFLSIDSYSAFKCVQGIFFSIGSLIAFLVSRDVLLTVIFQFSTFVGSIVFAGADIFFVPLLLIAIIALKSERYLIASTFLTLAVLTKWQPIWLVPFFLVHLINRLRQGVVAGRAAILSSTIPPLLILAIAAGVFHAQFFSKLFEAVSLEKISYSARTLNLGWIISYFVRKTPEFIDIVVVDLSAISIRAMRAAFLFVYVLALYKQLKNNSDFVSSLASMCIGYAAFLVLYPGIHANYWITLSTLLFVFTIDYKNANRLFLYVGVMANINLLFFYSWKYSRAVLSVDSTVFLAMANCCIFGWCVHTFYRKELQGASPKS